MILTTSLIIAVSTVVLAILIINKEVTLQVLSNITFKWIFDRKHHGDNFKNEAHDEVNFQTKGVKIDIKGNTSKIIGFRLLLVGSVNLLICGIGFLLSNPSPIAEFNGQIYIDDTFVGYILITYQLIVLGIFLIINTIDVMFKIKIT